MRTTTAALALVFLLLSSAAPPANADIVHLRTGEAVEGRPLRDQSDLDHLAIEDYGTGAVRRLEWSDVDPADRERLLKRWRWTEPFPSLVAGVVVEIRLADGSTDEIRGVVAEESDTEVQVRSGGRILTIPTSRVVDRFEEEMDVRDVWTPEELMERFFTYLREREEVDLEDLSSRHRFRIAEFAEWVGELETAKEHYEACLDDGERAAKGVERVSALLQDREAFDALMTARRKLGMNLFRRARAILTGFGEAHPEAGDAVRARHRELVAEFEDRRTEFFRRETRLRFVRTLEGLIAAKVREKDVSITDVSAWTRRELPEEAFAKLAAAMQRLDDVTPEEAQTFWERRTSARRPWRRVSYGSGTFIVRPPTIKPPARTAGGGGDPAGFQPPDPPRRDTWWREASNRDRSRWVLAYFVERSELFEIGEPQLRPCPLCNGKGLLSKTDSDGNVVTYLCTRCGGARLDVTVSYR